MIARHETRYFASRNCWSMLEPCIGNELDWCVHVFSSCFVFCVILYFVTVYPITFDVFSARLSKTQYLCMFPCVSHTFFFYSSQTVYRILDDVLCVRVVFLSSVVLYFFSLSYIVLPLSIVVLYPFLPIPVFIMCVEPFFMIIWFFLTAGGCGP